MLQEFLQILALANIYLSIPVSTASVERSFSKMKLIKTRIRNRIGPSQLSFLMKLAIETPETLSDADFIAIGTKSLEELLYECYLSYI